MHVIGRREFFARGAALAAGARAPALSKPKVAGLAMAYFPNSHADVILGRLMEGYTLDGRGEFPSIGLASLYLDQRAASDKGAKVASAHGVPLCDTVEGALTLGTGRLAVDGVMIVAEHGDYPKSPIGSTRYPKRRLFAQVVEVFRRSGRVVPVFLDKMIADNREDIAWMAEAVRDLKIPMMAGSVLPVARRDPAEDVQAGERLREIVALAYHTLDAYGFHALEAIQALAERREGGETGVRSVLSVSGAAAWEAVGAIGEGLVRLAASRSPDCGAPIEEWPRKVPDPVVWRIDYRDGLRAWVLTLNPIIGAWSVAWRAGGGPLRGVGFDTREVRPLMHFAGQVRGIASMVETGKPAWPVERTLLTSGLLEALLTSGARGGKLVETPHLAITYRSGWTWKQPPPYPPARPLDGP